MRQRGGGWWRRRPPTAAGVGRRAVAARGVGLLVGRQEAAAASRWPCAAAPFSHKAPPHRLFLLALSSNPPSLSPFPPSRSHVLAGIEAADSVAWNPHKMMGLPLACSAFLTRHRGERGSAEGAVLEGRGGGAALCERAGVACVLRGRGGGLPSASACACAYVLRVRGENAHTHARSRAATPPPHTTLTRAIATPTHSRAQPNGPPERRPAARRQRERRGVPLPARQAARRRGHRRQEPAVRPQERRAQAVVSGKRGWGCGVESQGVQGERGAQAVVRSGGRFWRQRGRDDSARREGRGGGRR